MRLKKKVVIISGAADPKGIGAAISKGFAEEGSKVVIADIVDGKRVVDSIKQGGGEALFLETDVTDQEACFAMSNATVERFGRVDVLVNNAAIYGNIVLKAFTDITTEEWQKILNVNLIGAFHCTKAVFPHLKQNAGRIINIASDVVDLGIPGMPHYVASKGGVIALTRCLARELGMFHINVNAVAPGLSMSDASRRVLENAAIPVKGAEEHVVQMRCLQRSQGIDDVVGTVLYLAGSHSDFVSGQCIAVNGGASFR